MPKVIELSNKQFGRLLVLSKLPSSPDYGGNIMWKCKCACGNIKHVVTRHLCSGTVKSCGCLQIEYQSKKKLGVNSPSWKGYGEISGHFWCELKRNAIDRKIPFKISIEQAWEKFLKQNKKCRFLKKMIHFDLPGKRSTGNASLDRIDSSKGYTIDNIQWVDKRVNIMKWSFTESEFLDICNEITKNNL